ncbi:MAG: hypothetical protein R3B93_03830 [Bacteroidia bacterium]
MGKPNEDLPTQSFDGASQTVMHTHFSHGFRRQNRQIPFIVIAENCSREARIKALKVWVDDAVLILDPKNSYSRISFLKDLKEKNPEVKRNSCQHA